MTDTDRLDFLLQFLSVDDVGDETACCGVIVNHEDLEAKLGFGPMIDGRAEALATWREDLRSVIDKAIAAHSANKRSPYSGKRGDEQ
jgi:hypothetical protein